MPVREHHRLERSAAGKELSIIDMSAYCGGTYCYQLAIQGEKKSWEEEKRQGDVRVVQGVVAQETKQKERERRNTPSPPYPHPEPEPGPEPVPLLPPLKWPSHVSCTAPSCPRDPHRPNSRSKFEPPSDSDGRGAPSSIPTSSGLNHCPKSPLKVQVPVRAEQPNVNKLIQPVRHAPDKLTAETIARRGWVRWHSGSGRAVGGWSSGVRGPGLTYILCNVAPEEKKEREIAHQTAHPTPSTTHPHPAPAEPQRRSLAKILVVQPDNNRALHVFDISDPAFPVVRSVRARVHSGAAPRGSARRALWLVFCRARLGLSRGLGPA
ncbi:hypothetical protein B0H14DRAFT_2580641 [Mycena olivaceomarginata]|nr:hypothetical protein B0H14DRAFT_2580641 [Mycena olivaceomarginata]